MNAPAVQSRPSSLEEAQALIEATRWGPLSLDPNRETATPLPILVQTLATRPHFDALAATAAAVAAAQLENFPDNLFWDFDRFLGSLHRHAVASQDYETYLTQATTTTVGLMQLYGQRSRIQFRYVHDFSYGFDWARWVRRDPDTRLGLDPFGLSFLDRSESRGRHILELIDADDTWYPRLDEGVSRNPFPFSREPEDEMRLYRDLSAHGFIPVHAWRIDGATDWDRDFDDLRTQRANALGLGRDQHRSSP